MSKTLFVDIIIKKEKWGFNLREKKEKKTVSKNLSDTLDIPESALSGLAHIEFLSNREVSVEGYRGVIEYDSTVIRLSADNMIIKIAGRNLSVKCYTPNGLVVGGYILSLEFLQ